ncbi:hypothetical protein PC111_g15205 [Phytophthora cactorum]|nr:hypothetical protein PC111_g15205 [Phytophthora cactorum]
MDQVSMRNYNISICVRKYQAAAGYNSLQSKA